MERQCRENMCSVFTLFRKCSFAQFEGHLRVSLCHAPVSGNHPRAIDLLDAPAYLKATTKLDRVV
jgi:hypothetical protein